MANQHTEKRTLPWRNALQSPGRGWRCGRGTALITESRRHPRERATAYAERSTAVRWSRKLTSLLTGYAYAALPENGLRSNPLERICVALYQE